MAKSRGRTTPPSKKVPPARASSSTQGPKGTSSTATKTKSTGPSTTGPTTTAAAGAQADQAKSTQGKSKQAKSKQRAGEGGGRSARQDQSPRAGRKPLPPEPPSTLAWAVTVGAVMLGVVALTNERTMYFGPRAAVLLVMAALGLPTLALRAWRSALAWPTRAAIGFLVVAAISAALSPAPLIGFFGANQLGTGWLFLVSLAALWALGTDLGESGAELLGKGLLLLALVNAGATVLEVGGEGWSVLGSLVNHIPGMQFGIGQPAGFAINPVYSAQIIVGGLALLAWRCAPRNPWTWWVMAVGLGVGTYLSGERYGLLFIAGLAIWVLVARKVKAAAAFFAAAGGGLIVGMLIQQLVRMGTTAHFRTFAAEGAGGAVGPRLKIWTTGLHAVIGRPLVGIGPGQSQTATFQYRSATSIIRDGAFPDTHNIIVEIAVTTGLVGLALFLAWLIPAFGRARGALLIYSLALFAGGLLEPLNLTTTSLGFLALGAATVGAVAHSSTSGSELPSWTTGAVTTARVLLVLVALFGGFAVIFGNTEFKSGIASVDPAPLIASSGHLPMWGDAANATSDVYTVQGQSKQSGALIAQAIIWANVAIARNPEDATAWRRLGFDQALVGQFGAASSSLQRAIRIDPSLQSAYIELVDVEVHRGESAAALRTAKRGRELFGGSLYNPLVPCLEHQIAISATPAEQKAACLSNSGAPGKP